MKTMLSKKKKLHWHPCSLTFSSVMCAQISIVWAQISIVWAQIIIVCAQSWIVCSQISIESSQKLAFLGHALLFSGLLVST